MDIVIDSHYCIGKNHWVCEDYACHGFAPVPYVILADGCSSSPETDAGARLLALNARRYLAAFVRSAADSPSRHWAIGRQLAADSARCAQALQLAPTAIDATLIVAFAVGQHLRIHCYGDGCILVRHPDNSLDLIRISYAGNAPYYLSYQTDDARRQQYFAEVGDYQAAQIIQYSSDIRTTTETKSCDSPIIFDFDWDACNAVAVTTDGLDSFFCADTGECANTLAIAQEMTDFKNYSEGFIKRRLRRQLKLYDKRHLYHSDDIGFGAFVRRVR